MLFKYYNRLRTPQSQTADSTGEDIPLRTQKVLNAIDNKRRRAVVVEVATRDTPVSLSTLSESLAADELGITPDSLSAQERKRVYISLYQTHLPTLDDLGAISYHTRDGTVGVSSATIPLAELIHDIEERSLTVK